MNTHRMIDADFVILQEGVELAPELTRRADQLRREGHRVGLTSLAVPDPLLWPLLLWPLLLGARAVAVVEPGPRNGFSWRQEVRAALERLHPAIPRLYSVMGAAPPLWLARQLTTNLPWIVQCMRDFAPDVLQMDVLPERKASLGAIAIPGVMIQEAPNALPAGALLHRLPRRQRIVAIRTGRPTLTVAAGVA